MLYLQTSSGCSVARSSRLLWEQEVAGSNPATPTLFKNYLFRDVAQPGSAHAWGAWGRRFKSCHPDLIKLLVRKIKPTFFYFTRLRYFNNIIIRSSRKKFSSCLLYTSPSPRDRTRSRMPSSA